MTEMQLQARNCIRTKLRDIVPIGLWFLLSLVGLFKQYQINYLFLGLGYNNYTPNIYHFFRKHGSNIKGIMILQIFVLMKPH